QTRLLLSSTNAADWTQESTTADTLAGVAYGNNSFVAVGAWATDSLNSSAVLSGGTTQPFLQTVGFVSSPKPGFRFLYGADQPPRPYRLQSSPSLAAPSWTDVLTNTVLSGYPPRPIPLTDTNANRVAQRFYRVVSP